MQDQTAFLEDVQHSYRHTSLPKYIVTCDARIVLDRLEHRRHTLTFLTIPNFLGGRGATGLVHLDHEYFGGCPVLGNETGDGCHSFRDTTHSHNLGQRKPSPCRFQRLPARGRLSQMLGDLPAPITTPPLLPAALGLDPARAFGAKGVGRVGGVGVGVGGRRIDSGIDGSGCASTRKGAWRRFSGAGLGFPTVRGFGFRRLRNPRAGSRHTIDTGTITTMATTIRSRRVGVRIVGRFVKQDEYLTSDCRLPRLGPIPQHLDDLEGGGYGKHGDSQGSRCDRSLGIALGGILIFLGYRRGLRRLLLWLRLLDLGGLLRLLWRGRGR